MPRRLQSSNPNDNKFSDRCICYHEEKVKDWLLSNIKKWKGLMGTFSLDNEGNSDLGFVIKQIRNDKPVLVQ